MIAQRPLLRTRDSASPATNSFGAMALVLIFAVPSYAFDASSCLSALEKLKREAGNGVDGAQQAEMACRGMSRSLLI